MVDDGGSNVALYNAEIEKAKAAGQGTWFTGGLRAVTMRARPDQDRSLLASLRDVSLSSVGTGPVRRARHRLTAPHASLRTMFASTRHFSSFDPSLAQKTKTLRSSGSGVAKAAAALDDVLSGRRAAGSELSKDELLLATFYEMAQM